MKFAFGVLVLSKNESKSDDYRRRLYIVSLYPLDSTRMLSSSFHKLFHILQAVMGLKLVLIDDSKMELDVPRMSKVDGSSIH